MTQPNKFFEVPLAILTTPRDGYRAIVDSWWPTLNGNPVGYRSSSTYCPAQCNKDRRIAEVVAAKLGLDAPVLVPLAFWPGEGMCSGFMARLVEDAKEKAGAR